MKPIAYLLFLIASTILGQAVCAVNWYPQNKVINHNIITNIQDNTVLDISPSTKTIAEWSISLKFQLLQFPQLAPIQYGVALYVLPSGWGYGTINLSNETAPLLNYGKLQLYGYTWQTRECGGPWVLEYDTAASFQYCAQVKLGPGDRLVLSVLSQGQNNFVTSMFGTFNELINYP